MCDQRLEITYYNHNTKKYLCFNCAVDAIVDNMHAVTSEIINTDAFLGDISCSECVLNLDDNSQ